MGFKNTTGLKRYSSDLQPGTCRKHEIYKDKESTTGYRCMYCGKDVNKPKKRRIK